MDVFRTVLPASHYDFEIDYSSRLLNIGSCFAENIAGYLREKKFDIVLNPFGIVYNPISIANVIDRLLGDRWFVEDDLIINNDLWHSFEHHGSFSCPDKEQVLDKINTALRSARSRLENIDRLIITLGTARVFIHKESGNIVANCHKLPQQSFDRRLLKVMAVVDALSHSLTKLKAVCPALEVILTVSPVRHIRDGLIENQRSKAALLLATDELIHHHDFIHYFPAYELMMDDLRDYRFYEADLVHPNQTATSYIWRYFQDSFMRASTLAIMAKVGAVIRAVRHRPLYPDSVPHQKFVKKQLEQIRQLEAAHPFLSFAREKEILIK